MRQHNLFIPTLREAPAEAEATSHHYLLRAGFIRQIAAGIYGYLPLGLRVLQKISAVVREEMERIGAQELLLPAMQPADLWQQSGRYDVYGQELIRLQDRNGREFALGPTHEEVITTLVRNEISSYRRLPLTLYQIQTKFRDERRPRFGLLRGREFLMKDAYSFDVDWQGLDRTYRSMYDAYNRIFERCGLRFRAVEADAGSIGGEGETHEFMVLADIGEDTVVTCAGCQYAANLEKAEAGLSESSGEAAAERSAAYEKFHTPNVSTIEQLAAFTGLPERHFAKTLIFAADGRTIAVLVRGDHEVNELKLQQALGAEKLELADAAATQAATGAPVGFAGPVGLAVPLYVDREAAAMEAVITGANEQDYHLRHVVPGRDFELERVGDYRNVLEGDNCPRCSGKLLFYRGIEVGHVFKLGTKYSEKLGACFIDETGKERPMIMGCYGIGISRLLSAVVEQHHDGQGIVWPASLAPFQVHLIVVSVKDERQMQLSERLYRQLREAGAQVMLDDRDERPGVKFKDADLIGIPVRITIGKLAGEGMVEYKVRDSLEQLTLSAEEAVARVYEFYKGEDS
ncbi:proline--tRNA ligase [Paenibacillus tarimensis]